MLCRKAFITPGLILKDQLEDCDAAAIDWDDLMKRYSD